MRYITKYFIRPSKSRLAGSTLQLTMYYDPKMSPKCGCWWVISHWFLIGISLEKWFCVFCYPSHFLSVKSVIVWQSSAVSSTNHPHVMTQRLLRPKITVAKVKFKLLFCQFNSIPPNLIYLLLCCQVFFWLQRKLFFRDKKCQFSPISVPHSLLQHFWITRQLLYENHFVCSTGRYF